MIRYQNKAIKFYHTNMKILFIDIYISGGGGVIKYKKRMLKIYSFNNAYNIQHTLFFFSRPGYESYRPM